MPDQPAQMRPDETGTGPRALLVTVYGAFLRRLGGWAAIADLIVLMGELDVDEQALRSAVSRLKRRGFLEPERRGRSAGYRLSDDAARILAAGDRRIFRAAAEADDAFLVIIFSVPEKDRGLRHVLRSRLAWLGCGNAAAGVWIAPVGIEEDVRELVARLGVEPHVTFFRGPHAGPGTLAEAVRGWWDLDALAALHDGFVARYAPLAAAGPPADDAAAFASYVRVLTGWRRLPFLDPGLPAAVLPAGWSGHASADVFARLVDGLAEPARRHVEAVVTTR